MIGSGGINYGREKLLSKLCEGSNERQIKLPICSQSLDQEFSCFIVDFRLSKHVLPIFFSVCPAATFDSCKDTLSLLFQYAVLFIKFKLDLALVCFAHENQFSLGGKGKRNFTHHLIPALSDEYRRFLGSVLDKRLVLQRISAALTLEHRLFAELDRLANGDKRRGHEEGPANNGRSVCRNV